jgi:hypothetical protein
VLTTSETCAGHKKLVLGTSKGVDHKKFAVTTTVPFVVYSTSSLVRKCLCPAQALFPAKLPMGEEFIATLRERRLAAA